MANRPRVVLYDTSNGNHVVSGYVDPISPTESEGEEVYNPITGKFERSRLSRYSKSGLGNNSLNQYAFQNTPPQPEVVYPDRVRRCSILRESTTQIMLGAIAGLLLGMLLSQFHVSDDFSNIVNLPGKVFLQVLKCFVVPMVFTSLSTTVADIVLLGKVSIVGTRTALIFTSLSFLGSAMSLAISMLLRNLVPHTKGVVAETSLAYFDIMCENGSYLTYNSTGTALCSATSMDSTTRFKFYDPTRVLLTDDTASAAATVSMQVHVTDILTQLIPSNIFWSFEQGLILSVTTFTIAFGAAAIKTSTRESSPLLDVLKQMNKVFFRVISKAIDWSPFAVMSLVAGSLSSQEMLGEAARHVGVLVLCTILSIVIFELVFFPILLWLTLRKNPFPFMRAMLPAAMFALGSSSSLVTLPVTLRCVESTREVPRSLLQFVVTIGCILHKNGSAIYFPCAIVFLVSTTEKGAVPLGWLQLVLILLLSVLGSMGTAPIPNSSVVMIYSIWTTIYPDKEVPASYSYLVAISWFLGRLVTVCNIVGDGYVARIIAEQIEDEDVDIEMQ